MIDASISHGWPLNDLENSSASPKNVPVTVGGRPIRSRAALIAVKAWLKDAPGAKSKLKVTEGNWF